MIKKLKLPLFIATIFASSCSSVYMPNVPNTPMLSQKGEFSGGLHISPRINTSINGAYAVSDHIGVLFSGSYINREKKSKDYRQKLVEIGGGWFDTFGPDNNRIIEIYAGFGAGNTDRVFREFDDNDILISRDVEEITYSKTFLQVNYSSKKNSNLRLFGTNYPLNYGTALRISNVDMKTFMRNSMGQVREGNIFLEPIFFTRMRLNETIQLQYTTSGTFGLNSRKHMNAGNSIFTIGAVINLNGKKAKESSN
ncbi:hypothetical protein [Pedobacter nyackensis]|uniref:Outer membrane protein beta-barrel domain-containing protein n=1 Tax=Pedobacter nyackensis TaxID=475255 RepID=A0A1W2D8Y5_9SPHI|nr:hypothetical protein [Pedobacter nyackensis]SMC93704.1 hypothetical protein SAMN04488101_10612 [Pedobacter nyackensis]